MLCYGHSPSSFMSSNVVAVGEFAEQGCMWQVKLNASNYATESLNTCYLSANNETKIPDFEENKKKEIAQHALVPKTVLQLGIFSDLSETVS